MLFEFATFEPGFGIAEEFWCSYNLPTLLRGQLMIRCAEYLEHYHDAHHQNMPFQCTLLKSAGNTGSDVHISPNGGRDGSLDRF